MSDQNLPPIGTIAWRDLTVDDADEIQDFYCDVIGWKAAPHDMGSYQDFNINLPDSGETIAGVCHAQGSNSNLPAQWLIYISVADVEKSATRATKLGGKVIDGPRTMGKNKFCVIQDPAGAVVALMS